MEPPTSCYPNCNCMELNFFCIIMPVDENTSPEKGGDGDGDNGHLIPLPIRCTFERCQGGFDSSFDSASNFVVHLKNNHQLIVFQIFQVAPFLESYLNYYFGQDNRECNIRSKFYSSDGITHIGAAPENPNQLADAPIRFKLEHSLLSRFLKQQKEYLSLSLENERCFICDETPGGSYAEYLAHLEEQHKLVLGKAYNLVFLPEFISVLRCRLVDQLCCIFCNANFENIDKVKMHMVDKRHFRINPLDKLFDKYYFINYQVIIFISLISRIVLIMMQTGAVVWIQIQAGGNGWNPILKKSNACLRMGTLLILMSLSKSICQRFTGLIFDNWSKNIHTLFMILSKSSITSENG